MITNYSLLANANDFRIVPDRRGLYSYTKCTWFGCERNSFVINA